jgi:CelD/BcsL family acetyltransferase involved in cellulose biosynthesis
MNIRLLRNVQQFEALRPEWNDLLSRSAADTIFLTWEWLCAWWEAYGGENDELFIVTVRERSGELIAILPMFRRFRPWFPLVRIRTVLFIGDGSADSDYLDAILMSGREDAILNAVWKWLSVERSAWGVLQLSNVPESSSTYRWLQRTSSQSQLVSRSDDIVCAVAELPNSWDEYLASLKPRFRTKVRSTLRDLMTGNGFRFYRIDNSADLTAGLQTLYDLHGKRWELKGTEGVFRNPKKRRFYEQFTDLFLKRGWLAFDFLELNGRPVACQMCFIYRGTQFLLQEGFDPEFGSDSVGIGLRALVFKRAIEDGLRRYDFLAGIGRHKTQWNARVKYCHSVSLGYRTIRNTVYLRAPVVMQGIRERIKPMLPGKVLEIRRRFAAS